MPKYITDNFDKENSTKKKSAEEILMKKVKYKKNYFGICLFFTFLMSQMIHPYIQQNKIITFKVTQIILSDFD